MEKRGDITIIHLHAY